MARILKPDGIMLITVPYGRHYNISPKRRTYDSDILKQLFAGLDDVKTKIDYFIEENGQWSQTSKSEAANVDSSKHTKAVACIKVS